MAGVEIVSECAPCLRGEHRFCVVGNCDFCPKCKQTRSSTAGLPQPTPEQALRILQILGEWTRRGYHHEVELEGGHDPRVRVIYTDPDIASGQYQEGLVSYGANHFDALCQATTAMQALLEVSGHAKSDQ